MKTFATWLEEELQSEPTGSATPVPTRSEQLMREAFERLLSALPSIAPSQVAQAPWAEELGVERPYDIDAIKRAFRRLAFRTHPDRAGGSHAAFLRAQELLEEALSWRTPARGEADRSRHRQGAYANRASASVPAMYAVYA